METAIGHIAFHSVHVKEMISFYQTLLEFAPAFELKDDAGQPWIVYLANPKGQFIELFYTEETPPYENAVKARCGYSHFCLETDDIRQIAAKAESAGIPFYKPLKKGKDNNWQCWFQDPDGLLIEVMQIDESSPQADIRKKLGVSVL